jgi:hypothetical protein
MADDKKGKKEVNPEAEAKNWEDRIHTEQEAPHKWNEAWGELFNNELPHDYGKRVDYLEKQLKSLPPAQSLPKYGLGKGFKEIMLNDHRRHKMFDVGKYEE